MTKKKFGLGKLLCALALLTSLSSPALAQATRTWVSGVGDDVNPCSRTAPCKTFAGAISKTADGGEISVLDPGGFGAVTVTKSITISGDGTLASILAAGVNGVVVNCVSLPNCVVTLRSLSIEGAGTGLNGIRFLAGGRLHVEHVTIAGFTGHGIDFEPSTSAAFHVRDVAIRESDTGAVLVKPSGTASATGTIERTVMDNNGRGLRVEDRSVVHVRDSRAASNVANGFVALAQAGGALSLTLDRVLSVSNGATGVYAGALATVLLSDSTIARNKDGLQAVGGGSIVSDGNNRVFGNTNSNGTPSSMLVPM
jgi:hypothetical protein